MPALQAAEGGWGGNSLTAEPGTADGDVLWAFLPRQRLKGLRPCQSDTHCGRLYPPAGIRVNFKFHSLLGPEVSL